MDSSDLQKVPGYAKASGAILGVGGLAALIWKYHDQAAVLLIILIGVIVVIAAVIAFSKVGALKAKGKAKSFRDDLGSKLRSTPGGVMDADSRAKLDDLRRSLQGGIEKLQATGKNLYSLPWYLVVGEPGSGKTKAIAAAKIAAPGFQDALQGAGGTVNMNWWFTQNGIILDTAGRLMLPEVNTGDNPEWDEFLRTLNRRRPNCPINGLILAIPADTLITDSASEIDRKAGDIAFQFNKLQVTLGIRFPVFVLITKSDKILGFREFFESVNQPDEQAQLLGWSNPEKLDDAFKPELVEEHLTKVHEQLVRRRARLIQDPVHTDDPGGRRLDQIDALYELPEALVGLAPRLRRYLEPIFISGPLSSRPLFLRGIYFTSSLQTGEAVDAAMSAIMGADVAKSHTGGVVSEKPYFLKHVFVEKVFKEKGLVTRTSNVGVLKKRRKMAVLGAGIASVLALTGFTWFSRNQLDKDMVNHVTAWEGSNKWGDKDTDKQIIDVEDGKYHGQKTSGAAKLTLVQLHTGLRQEIPQQVHVPVVFRPVATLTGNLDKDRRDAYSAFFAGKVLAPVVTRARNLLESSGGRPWTPDGTQALRQLIMLDAHRPLNVPGKESFDLDKIVPYTLTDDADKDAWKHDSPKWAENLRWTYAPAPDGAGATWPPEDLAKREFLGVSITKGTKNFIDDAITRAEQSKSQQKLVQVVADKLAALEEAEVSLLGLKPKIVKTSDKWDDKSNPGSETVNEWRDRRAKVDTAKKDLDVALTELETKGGWKQTSATDPGLAAYYQDLVQGSIKRQLDDYDSLLEPIPADTSGDPALADARAQLDNAKAVAEKQRDLAKKDVFSEKLKLEKIMLCRVPGADAPKRLYEVQYAEVKLADDELPKDAPQTVPPDFATAFGAVAKDVDDATATFTRDREASGPETREGQLCDLGGLLTKNVSGPRRKWQLLDVAVRGAAGEKAEWAERMKAVSLPAGTIQIALTTNIGAAFPAYANDPRRLSGIQKEWDATLKAGGLLGPGKPPGIMDWDDLSNTAIKKNAGFKELHDDFVQYWDQGYKVDWELKPGVKWFDLQETLKKMDVDSVNKAIRAFAELQSQALALSKPTTEPPTVSGPPPALVTKAGVCLTSWKGLSSDAGEARVALMANTDADWSEHYLLVFGHDVAPPPSASLYDQYWTNVFALALDAVGRSAVDSSKTAFETLQAKYQHFPLVPPDFAKETQGRLDELNAKELAEACDYIDRLWGRWQPKAAVAAAVVPGVGITSTDFYRPAMAQLTNATEGALPKDPVQLAWARNLKLLQPWLMALRDKKLACRFSFSRMGEVGGGDVSSMSDRYFYGEIDMNEGVKVVPLVDQQKVSVFNLRFQGSGPDELPVPGLIINSRPGPIALGLHSEITGPVKKSVDLARGTWPQIRLLVEAGRDEKDRTVTRLPMGAAGKNVFLVTFHTVLTEADGSTSKRIIDYKVNLNNPYTDDECPLGVWNVK